MEFSTLVGRTLVAVRNLNNEQIVFETAEGETFALYHEQDCCECVTVESVSGDLDDLVGTPILMAEAATSIEDPPGCSPTQYRDDSQTWTFYKLRTIKGSVDIRWYGSSNGYYSERVTFGKGRQ